VLYSDSRGRKAEFLRQTKTKKRDHEEGNSRNQEKEGTASFQLS